MCAIFRNKSKVVGTLFILFISIYFGVSVSRMLMPQYQFTINTRDIAQEKISVVNYINNGTIYEAKREGDKFLLHISQGQFPDTILLSFKVSQADGKVYDTTATVNGIIVPSDLIDLRDTELKPSGYGGLSIVKFERHYPFKAAKETAIILALLVLLGSLYKEVSGKNVKITSLLLYSDAVIRHFTRKELLFIIGIVFLTTLAVVGVDAKVIYNALRFHSSGLDLYQFQVCSRVITKFDFPEFPYNPMMLFVWSPFFSVWDTIVARIPAIYGYPYIQVLFLKVMNAVLGTLTILSILSYLTDKKYLANHKVCQTILFCFFNPVFFYIAILFIQLDTLSMYLITLGILLLTRPERLICLPILLVTAGMFTKLQVAIAFPVVVICYTYWLLNDQQEARWHKLKTAMVAIGIFGVISYLFFFVHYHSGHAFYELLSHFTQKDRIWWTVIQYAPQLSLFLSIFFPLMFLLIYMFYLDTRIKLDQIVCSSLLLLGSLVFIFNFTIMHSPSSLLLTVPAFTVLYALRQDTIAKIVIFFSSFLVIISYAGSDFGDISRIIFGWSVDSANLLSAKISSAKKYSVLFTVSNTAMVALSYYFLKEALAIIKKSKES